MARYQPSRRPRAGSSRGAAGASPPVSFSRSVIEQLPGDRSEFSALVGEDLAHLDYAAELSLKDTALESFWRQARLPARPDCPRRDRAPGPCLIGDPRPRLVRQRERKGPVIHLAAFLWSVLDSASLSLVPLVRYLSDAGRALFPGGRPTESQGGRQGANLALWASARLRLPASVIAPSPATSQMNRTSRRSAAM